MRPLTRRAFLASALAAPAAALYAWRVEPHWLEVVRRDLPVAGLPPALDGARLVQLSDLHIGSQVDPAFVAAGFARVRALDPDFVVFTGDLVTYAGAPTFDQVGETLPGFPRGRRGTFACLGNHDYGRRWREGVVADRVTAALEDVGVRVLRNERAVVDGLTVVGIDDLWAGHFLPAQAFRGHDPDAPAVALCHNPDAADRAGWGGFRGWILAGHTHGGQCRPPFLPPPLLPVQNRRYTAGEFDLGDGRSLYISRGLGHLERVRFLVRPEVTCFTLRPAPLTAAPRPRTS
jgi:predicted MPP superfamily phosphohydrolase